jgi:hypothetical protein
MSPEIDRFHRWLRCWNPYATTYVRYTSDVKLFFDWVAKPPAAITLHDADRYVAYCRDLGHAPATVNRRLLERDTESVVLRRLFTNWAVDTRPPIDYN